VKASREIAMAKTSSVIFHTNQADEADSETAGTSRARKKKGSLATKLDPLLTPRFASGRPGRPKGLANYEWTSEADRMLMDLCEKWGPTKAKHLMQRKLVELGIVGAGARPDTLRKAVEHRMAKLGLPTGQPRKTSADRATKRWTEGQTAALLGSLGADATIESVAVRTGHTVKSVLAKLARLGYRVHEVPGFAVFTIDQLSALLHVTLRQVRRWKEKGWLQSKDRRITERDLGQFLREHADGVDFESLPRETQVYLVDLGYPCEESANFRKNVREILDSVGRQRKYRRKSRASGEDGQGGQADEDAADESAGETSLIGDQHASE
jgi:hypothetical protein